MTEKLVKIDCLNGRLRVDAIKAAVASDDLDGWCPDWKFRWLLALENHVRREIELISMAERDFDTVTPDWLDFFAHIRGVIRVEEFRKAKLDRDDEKRWMQKVWLRIVWEFVYVARNFFSEGFKAGQRAALKGESPEEAEIDDDDFEDHDFEETEEKAADVKDEAVDAH